MNEYEERDLFNTDDHWIEIRQSTLDRKISDAFWNGFLVSGLVWATGGLVILFWMFP